MCKRVSENTVSGDVCGVKEHVSVGESVTILVNYELILVSIHTFFVYIYASTIHFRQHECHCECFRVPLFVYGNIESVYLHIR